MTKSSPSQLVKCYYARQEHRKSKWAKSSTAHTKPAHSSGKHEKLNNTRARVTLDLVKWVDGEVRHLIVWKSLLKVVPDNDTPIGLLRVQTKQLSIIHVNIDEDPMQPSLLCAQSPHCTLGTAASTWHTCSERKKKMCVHRIER